MLGVRIEWRGNSDVKELYALSGAQSEKHADPGLVGW
jgi:hypothetical protein